MAADCLVIEGHAKAYERDWDGAARVYMAAVAFGSEFRSGDLEMNLVGIAISRLRLNALVHLIASFDGPRTLARKVQADLSKFEKCLGNVQIGIQVERLRLTRLAIEHARAYAKRRGNGIRSILTPRTLFAAYRLHLDELLLRHLDKVPYLRDPDERRRLAEQINMWTGTTFVREDLPDWLGAYVAGEDVLRLYNAVNVTVQLQEWRADHQEYPEDARLLGIPLDRYGLIYERSAPDGFKLSSATSTGNSRTVIVNRAPRQAHLAYQSQH